MNKYGRTENGDQNYINIIFKNEQKFDYENDRRGCLIDLFDLIIDQDGYY